MISTLILALLLFQGSVSISGGKSNSSRVNEYVQCSISLHPEKVKAGAKAEIQFRLTPKKGIHINLRPAMNIVLDSAMIIPEGKLEAPTDTSTGYLDVSRPIRQTITVSGKIPPGEVHLKGLFTYFYCSDAEGWCSRFKQPVDITVTIVR